MNRARHVLLALLFVSGVVTACSSSSSSSGASDAGTNDEGGSSGGGSDAGNSSDAADSDDAGQTGNDAASGSYADCVFTLTGAVSASNVSCATAHSNLQAGAGEVFFGGTQGSTGMMVSVNFPNAVTTGSYSSATTGANGGVQIQSGDSWAASCGNTGTVGSWSLTITDVGPTDTSGNKLHGSFNATADGIEGTPGTVTVQATF